MPYITNSDAASYVDCQEPFQTNNKTLFARKRDGLYVVYSYGEHFPLYVYDFVSGVWFGNGDRYSVTTTRHKTHARPQGEITWCSTDYLRGMIVAGSYASAVADRIIEEQAA